MKKETIEAGVTTTSVETPAEASAQETLHGRSVFAIEMTASGLSVRTVFLSDQNQLIEMPALFPDVHYALSQIDELRRMVMERFAEAAQIGAQVIAAQAAEQNLKTAGKRRFSEAPA
ncbi:MAG: hypothetical protein WCG31_06365 [Deltaproteobacteria bacterium]|jgi:hypothetical protein